VQFWRISEFGGLTGGGLTRGTCIGVRITAVSVSPLAYLKNQMSIFHEIFCTCYLYSWLCRLLTTVQ